MRGFEILNCYHKNSKAAFGSMVLSYMDLKFDMSYLFISFLGAKFDISIIDFQSFAFKISFQIYASKRI